mmetsp:Transcript_33329/g.51733  ORF Transcript_33329/g.51733 Transcript_33329/m.51733 type:complete len:224 (-) Transcript_33329:1464-2135(-)
MSPGSLNAGVRIGVRSRFFVLAFRRLSSCISRSERPTSSFTVLMPRDAMVSLTSSATIHRKLTTCSGIPLNFLRSSGSWVAMPTGHTLRWHLRIMMQPMAMSGAVAKPNISAPSAAARATSRPVRRQPSVSRLTRERSPLSTSVWCVSAMPSSKGKPACLMPVQRDAPVPPSWPEMRMWSALALATPAATTPTPTSDTSLTDTSAPRLAFLRSEMSCARSSIE